MGDLTAKSVMLAESDQFGSSQELPSITTKGRSFSVQRSASTEMRLDLLLDFRLGLP